MLLKFISIILVSIFVFGYFTEAFDRDSCDLRLVYQGPTSISADTHAAHTHDDTEKTATEGHGQFGFNLSMMLPDTSCEFAFFIFLQGSIDYFFIPTHREISVLLRTPIS